MAYAPQEEDQQYHQQNNPYDDNQQYNQQDQYGQQQQQGQQQYQQQEHGFTCHLCYKAFTKDPNTNEILYKKIGDKLLHFECFRCANCNNMIQGKFNTREDGTYLCVNCIQQAYGQNTHVVTLDKNNPNYCVVCNKELTQNWVVGRNGDKYHNYCFKCMDCGSPLSKQPEYCEHDGKNYCKPCRTKQMQ
eukprot:574540_1